MIETTKTLKLIKFWLLRKFRSNYKHEILIENNGCQNFLRTILHSCEIDGVQKICLAAKKAFWPWAHEEVHNKTKRMIDEKE